MNFVLLKIENILDISIREFKFNSKLYGKYEFALEFIRFWTLSHFPLKVPTKCQRYNICVLWENFFKSPAVQHLPVFMLDVITVVTFSSREKVRWHFYRPQRSSGKVVFLHVSVILSGGVWQTPPPLGRHLLRQTPPPRQTCSPSQTPPNRHSS